MTQRILAQVLQWRLQWYKGCWCSPTLVEGYLSKMLNMKVSPKWHHFYVNNCDWLMLPVHECMNV